MYNAIYRNQYRDPEIECFFMSTYDNAANIPIEEIEKIRHTHSVDELDARLYGKFLKFAGLIYKEFDDAVHIVHPFRIPDAWIKYRWIDHGLDDPCACLWMAISPDDEYFFYREYYTPNRTIQKNSKAIKEMSGGERLALSYIGWESNKRNATTNVTDYREYLLNGIKPLRLWPKVEINTKINKVITRLHEKKLFIFRDCVNTISEIKTWGRDKNGEPERGNDHALDCIGAACIVNPTYAQARQMGNTMDEIPAEETPGNF
jgi:hypothetical protein